MDRHSRLLFRRGKRNPPGERGPTGAAQLNLRTGAGLLRFFFSEETIGARLVKYI